MIENDVPLFKKDATISCSREFREATIVLMQPVSQDHIVAPAEANLSIPKIRSVLNLNPDL